MLRHFVGQTSPHELQITHRIRSICQVFSLTSTHIAPVGHLRWHKRQVMHRSGSITICPRVTGVRFAGRTGYIRVAGVDNTLLMTVTAIFRIAMWISPLRAADTGVNRQYNNGDIGELAAGEHFHERGDVRKCRRPYTGSYKVLLPVAFDIMN